MQPATIEKVGESSQLTSRQPFSKGNSFKEENGNFSNVKAGPGETVLPLPLAASDGSEKASLV
jgi:hypothetical protein